MVRDGLKAVIKIAYNNQKAENTIENMMIDLIENGKSPLPFCLPPD